MRGSSHGTLRSTFEDVDEKQWGETFGAKKRAPCDWCLEHRRKRIFHLGGRCPGDAGDPGRLISPFRRPKFEEDDRRMYGRSSYTGFGDTPNPGPYGTDGLGGKIQGRER